ncbi:MAG: TlpA family protein disulfide reductase [Gammaproteobacteria bacterium]|nr:TlpA family protein disulfide reductase [Gammaproteobacteria bacterium]
MQNFHSKSLDRDFAAIYFVTEFLSSNQASNTAAPSGQIGTPQAPYPVNSRTSKTPGEVVAGGFLVDASLDGLNTENKSLSEYRGKPLIINVWASWCDPCRAEMGSLERLAKRYNGKEFNIIGISTDDYLDKAAAFIDQAALSFENYIDHELLMENMLGATTIPLTVLVDADGRVLMKVRGSREWDSPEILQAIGNVFKVTLL